MSAAPTAATTTTEAKKEAALYDQHHSNVELSDSDSSVSDVVGESSSQRIAPRGGVSVPDIDVLQLHDDEALPTASAISPQATAASSTTVADAQTSPAAAAANNADTGSCCQCGHPIGSTKPAVTKDGPLHPQCIAEYKFLHQPRCRYCSIRFRDSEAGSFVKDAGTGHLYHSKCRALQEAGVRYVQPTKEGEVRKFAIARSKLSRHNWKSRYFVLSPANGGIRYYASKSAAGSSGSKKGEDAKSDGTASYDADADPDRDAKEAKRSKGMVPLSNRSRLLTRPQLSNYRVSSSGASDNDIGIIFFESPDSKKELRLVFQCESVAERNAWVQALEAYIYTVDDPADYTAARTEAAAAAAKEKEETEEEEKKEEKEEKKEAKKK